MELDRLGLKLFIIKNKKQLKFFLAKLQRCREEREKLIREEELEKPSSVKISQPSTNSYFNKIRKKKDFSLLNFLHLEMHNVI